MIVWRNWRGLFPWHRQMAGAPSSTQPDFTWRVLRDLPYKAGAQDDYERQRCRLDLYLPEGAADFPVLVWFHGGGIEGGFKEDVKDVAPRLLARGLAVASVEYRLSPHVHYPAYVDDAAAAVAWGLEHIAAYGGNPRGVFVGGHSAGGYLAGQVGLAREFLAKYGHDTAELAGLLPMSGQMLTHFTIRKERGLPQPELTPVLDEAGPLRHVHAAAPPLLAICGDRDWAARTEENRLLIACLKAAGHRQADYLEIADRDHCGVFDRMAQPGDPATAAALAFVAGHAPAARRL